MKACLELSVDDYEPGCDYVGYLHENAIDSNFIKSVPSRIIQ